MANAEVLFGVEALGVVVSGGVPEDAMWQSGAATSGTGHYQVSFELPDAIAFFGAQGYWESGKIDRGASRLVVFARVDEALSAPLAIRLGVVTSDCTVLPDLVVTAPTVVHMQLQDDRGDKVTGARVLVEFSAEGETGEIDDTGFVHRKRGEAGEVLVRLHLFGDSETFEKIVMPGLPSTGDLVLAVHRPGFVDWAWRGERVPGQVHGVVIHRGTSVRGAVVGKDGIPRDGLPVTLMGVDKSLPWSQMPLAVTADDGSFEVHGLPPNARLSIGKPCPVGFAGPSSVVAVLHVPGGHDGEMIDVGQVRPAGRRVVRGVIRGANPPSLRSAEVYLFNLDGVGAVAKPDDRGAFEFRDIPDGVYELRVSVDHETHGRLDEVVVAPEMGQIVVPFLSR